MGYHAPAHGICTTATSRRWEWECEAFSAEKFERLLFVDVELPDRELLVKLLERGLLEADVDDSRGLLEVKELDLGLLEALELLDLRLLDPVEELDLGLLEALELPELRELLDVKLPDPRRLLLLFSEV